MTRLRAIEARDHAVLDRQGSDPDSAGENNWFGYVAPGATQRRLDRRHSSGDGGMLAVVDDDDQVVGEVSWVTAVNGPPPNGACWNLGIWIAPEHRGAGHGAQAQRLAAAYLFEHTLMHRVEAGTEGDNLAEQRALEKAGFTREGTLRQACFRGGAYHDMVVFSKLRGEP